MIDPEFGRDETRDEMSWPYRYAAQALFVRERATQGAAIGLPGRLAELLGRTRFASAVTPDDA